MVARTVPGPLPSPRLVTIYISLGAQQTPPNMATSLRSPAPSRPIFAEERTAFIHMLQEVAVAKECRISILSGDAHVAGVGRLYSQPKYKHLECVLRREGGSIWR